VVHSLSPWKGERDRVRGRVEGLPVDLVNGDETFPLTPALSPSAGERENRRLRKSGMGFSLSRAEGERAGVRGLGW